jgi:hypothetical protein
LGGLGYRGEHKLILKYVYAHPEGLSERRYEPLFCKHFYEPSDSENHDISVFVKFGFWWKTALDTDPGSISGATRFSEK